MRPSSEVAATVRWWARKVTCEGPSAYAIPIGGNDEDFVDWVPNTSVYITYVVSHGDQHIVIKNIE